MLCFKKIFLPAYVLDILYCVSTINFFPRKNVSSSNNGVKCTHMLPILFY